MKIQTTSHLFNGASLSSGDAISKIAVALTIAGSDPTSGAGIQADLKTFEAHGVYGLSVITALTAQSTRGVENVFSISREAVKQQCETLIGDIPIKFVKTGMIFDGEICSFVADFIFRNHLTAVIDTPLTASDGMALIDEKAFEFFLSELLPQAELITPNIFEAEMLSGVCIRSKKDIENAALIILGYGAKGVLIKGGHLGGEYSSDFLKTSSDSLWLDAVRVESANPHGTGCTLSSAITANLALGFSLIESVKNSKEYITEAIRNSISIGHGRNVLSHS
jgi:hydroxymethylpyrimidine/phosphomethylpyrimidine kinase